MRSRRRIVVAVLTVVALVVGCIQFHEVAEIMPDGSGTVTVSYSVSLKSKLLVDESATAYSVYETVAAESEGLAAVTDASVTQTDGRQRFEFTAWFEDANRLKLQFKERPALALSWKKEGDGYALEATLGGARSVAEQIVESEKTPPPPGTELDDGMAEFLDVLRTAVFKGLDLRTEIRLPGKITSVEGFEKIDDRTVRFELDGEGVKDTAAMKRLARQVFIVRCGPSVVPKRRVDAFAKELAAARKAWNENPASRLVQAEAASIIAPANAPEYAILRVLPSGDRFAVVDTASDYDAITLFDASGKKLSSFETINGGLSDLAVSPDGKRLYVVASVHSYVAAFAVPSGEVLWEQMADVPDGTKPPYWDVHVLRSGDLAIGKGFHAVDIHDAKSGERKQAVPVTGKANVLCVTHEHSRFVVSDRDHEQVSLMDAKTGKRVWTIEVTFRGKTKFAQTATTGRDGGPVIVTTGDDSGFEVFALDLADGKELWRLDFPRVSVSVAPSGRVAVASHADALWAIDVVQGQRLGRVVGVGERTRRLTFGVDDATLWIVAGSIGDLSFRSYRLDLTASEDE